MAQHVVVSGVDKSGLGSDHGQNISDEMAIPLEW